MNLEQAKANIGKEVVLLEDTQPYSAVTIYNEETLKELLEMEKLIIDDVEDDSGLVAIGWLLINPKHIKLKG